ncbi:hypothetical protein BGZ52_012290 [Haplosporangium bisporale]|nr:hypothetical protein BGZ52_012290 [Haplosporangium bisporale]
MDQVGVMFRASGTYGNWSGQEEDAICQLFVVADRQFELSQAVEDWIGDETVAPLLKILGGFNKMADQDGSAGKTDPESKSDEVPGTRFS